MIGRVHKRAVTQVSVEGVGLELVVGHEEIQRLVAIIVSEIEPHARLGPPVFTEAHTQRQSGLFEAAVTEVPEEKIHDRVVRDVVECSGSSSVLVAYISRMTSVGAWQRRRRPCVVTT